MNSIKILFRRFRLNTRRQPEAKHCSLPLPPHHSNPTSVSLSNMLHNGQAQSSAANLAAPALVDAVEPLKNAISLLRL